MLTEKGIEAIRKRLREATPGPWHWTSFGEAPQLEGSIEYAEMNPVLVAHGCNNDKENSSGIRGCMSDKFDDPLKACPLHPSSEDRDFIAHAYDDIQSLLDYVSTWRTGE